MAAISANDMRGGMAVVLDGQVHVVISYQHIKRGRGSAFVRCRLKNIETGAIYEKTFSPDEKIEQAYIDRKPMQYLYSDGDNFYFMDTQTYEQTGLSSEDLGDNVNFLKEGLELTALLYNGRLVGVELPTFVELEVVETEPGVRGDTVSGGSKPARLETGAVVQVPLFVNAGDVIRVDTRTGEYVERVK